ncbi:D-2-hydroxyacid dehydrogenase [Metabacillus herbersteinensis]|uniref:D-2-hydroxyacid dehydrogenase n=1 Tax=Metabacillus herbersteinensis TaxID=283816 RepID=A0ABV6GJD2_9BACI
MKILSTVKMPIEFKQKLEDQFSEDVTFLHDRKMNKVDKELTEADVILTYGEDMTSEHIQNAKNLKWIMVASAGIEKMPFEELEKRNILVTNAKGVHKTPMAEYCLAMMLQISRQAKRLAENQRDQKWDRRVEMQELYGKTLLVIGAGAIGSEISRMANAFGMSTIGLNQNGQDVGCFDETYPLSQLDYLLSGADFVISVLPSTEKTKGILTYEQFKKMKNTAIFINIGRGDVLIEKDLIAALNEGEIHHAVLDVFIKEPLEREHPFWSMGNVTVTPHLSGITNEYLPRAFEIFKQNLSLFLNGTHDQMRNIINLNRRY